MHQLILNRTVADDRDMKCKTPILSTLNKGFNSFHDIVFPTDRKEKYRSRSRRIQTMINQFSITNKHFHSNSIMQKSNLNRSISSLSNFDDTCPTLADTLRQNKKRLDRVKTQVQDLRSHQFSQYIKKSLRYQQLLNLNQNKKKHLPTMNTKIGQIIKKSAVEGLAKNLFYEIKFEKIPLQGWKPESREGHTTIIYKNNAIIIGGHCSHPFSMAQVYSFQKNVWIKQISTQSARSYHSSLLYKNRFIVTFGGMGQYDVSRKCRNCYNNVNLIDLSNFTTRAMKMHNQDNIQPRRSHCAVLMSKNMIILGGMNAKKQFLNDLIYLDLKELRWYHKQLKIQGKQLTQNMQTGIAKHKAITMFNKDRKQLSFYLPDYNEHEGIYIFGGLYGNGQENIVLQMSFNKYLPSLKRVDYSGLPPSNIDPILERHHDNIIIVSGDQKQRQIRIFKPQTRQFVIIADSDSKLLGGIGSTISKYEDSYYVFFGLGEDGYIGGISTFIIEQKAKQRQIKKKKIKYSNGQILDWRDPNWQIDSEAEFQ